MQMNTNKNGRSISKQAHCHLILTQVTPEICPFVGETLDDDHHSTSTKAPPSPTTGTTVSPAVTTTETSGTKITTSSTTSSSTEKHASNGGQDHHEVPSDKDGNTGGGGSTVGIILAVLALISVAGAGCFMLLRNPERRDQLRSLFRRRNVLVSYSRVRSNDDGNLLMNPSGALSDSDDEMLI